MPPAERPVLPLPRRSRSKTTGFRPRSARCQAMLAPITPPPMMSASARSAKGLRPLERRLPDEGIGPLLEADGGLGAVAGQDPGVGGKGEEALANGTREERPVAAGNIRAADRAAEENGPRDQAVGGGDGHAPGRV